MPRFSVDDVEIDVEDFVVSLSDREMEELISYLDKEGYLKTLIVSQRMHAAEEEYEEALNKLHGKWNRLPFDETDAIIKMAKNL